MSTISKDSSEKKNVTLEGVAWAIEEVGVHWSQYKKNIAFRVKKSSQGTGVIIAVNSINKTIGLFKEEIVKNWILTNLNSGKEVWGCVTYLPKNKPSSNTKFKDPVLVSLSSGSIPQIKHKPKTLPNYTHSLYVDYSDQLLKRPKAPTQLNYNKHPISGKCFKPNLNLKSFKKKFSGKIGIYCIYSRCFFTYIGQSINIYERFEKHVSDLKRGVHHNKAMQTDWNRTSEKTFSFHMIRECEIRELDQLEREYIEAYKTYEYGYNSTPDGQGDNTYGQTYQGISPKTQEIDKLLASNEEDLIEIDTSVEEYINNLFNKTVIETTTDYDADLPFYGINKSLEQNNENITPLIIKDKISTFPDSISTEEAIKSKDVLNQPDIMFQPTKFTTLYSNVEVVSQVAKNKTKSSSVEVKDHKKGKFRAFLIDPMLLLVIVMLILCWQLLK